MKSFKFSFLLLLIATVLCSCEKSIGLEEASSDPISIFKEVHSVMDQRYSLFSQKEVDWTEVYKEYSTQITNTASERELFLLIGKMLETLYDGHVALISSTDTIAYDDFYRLYPLNYNYKNILDYYLLDDYKQSGPFKYKVSENVAYLNYPSFSQDFTSEELDKIIKEIQSSKGLIIDIRSNPGGKLRNVDELFSRFIQEKKMVKYEVRKNGPGHDDFSDPVSYFISPDSINYNQPVIVLTNRSCFSACNDFVAFMADLPQVKLYGDQTGGGGSIPNNFILSNGWILQYSSSMTLTPEKISIEKGIEPDVRIIISALQEANGIDPIIDQAFLNLK